MILETDFADFLQDIRPTKPMRDNLKAGHQILRERLNADEVLKKCLVSDFLQGSYKRSTAIRPKGDRRSDVDIIVVTKLAEAEYTPEKAMDVFEPFLDKHYKGKWRQQGRSFGIELSYVELDLVLTSAPSEAEAGILRSEALSADDGLVGGHHDPQKHDASLVSQARVVT
jgi:tRNA nucleotidyltransferase (CCA-adding enzyme)